MHGTFITVIKIITHFQNFAFQQTRVLSSTAVRTWNLEFFIVYNFFSYAMFPKLDLFLLEDLKRRNVCCTQLVPSERASLWISQIRSLTEVKMMDVSESSSHVYCDSSVSNI